MASGATLNVDTAVENFLSNSELLTNFTQVLDEVWEADCTAKKATKKKAKIDNPVISTEMMQTATCSTTSKSDTTLTTPPHHPGVFVDTDAYKNVVESENCDFSGNTEVTHCVDDVCSEAPSYDLNVSATQTQEAPNRLLSSSLTSEQDSINSLQSKFQKENENISLTFASDTEERIEESSNVESVSNSKDVPKVIDVTSLDDVSSEKQVQRSDFAIRVLLPVKEFDPQLETVEVETVTNHNLELISTNETVTSLQHSNSSDFSKTISTTESFQANPIEACRQNLVPLNTVMTAVTVFEVGHSKSYTGNVQTPLPINLSTVQPISSAELSRMPRFPDLAVQRISSLPISNETKSSFEFQLRPLQMPPKSESSFPMAITPLCSSTPTPLTRLMSVDRREINPCSFPDLSLVSPNSSLEPKAQGGKRQNLKCFFLVIVKYSTTSH